MIEDDGISYLPDTSVIINGGMKNFLTKIEHNENITVIFHAAMLAELEHQANLGKEIGLDGLNELKEIRQILTKNDAKILYEGSRPRYYEIRGAKLGEVDALIRDYAFENNHKLITSDNVQYISGLALGLEVEYIKVANNIEKHLDIEQYFTEETMSIHLKQDVPPHVKTGRPGNTTFKRISDIKLTKNNLKAYAREIMEKAQVFEDTFIEIDRIGSTIVQYSNMRIVICRPPFSDGWEITAVRPRVRLDLSDYELSERLFDRLEQKAEGVLVAGSPGAGKTTFARALALYYEKKQKIVKTIESPRDLDLKAEITQYSKNFGDSSEIHDILLLSRPDYTIFDEVRDTNDFTLYADLRLSGIGMIGVLHSTSAIDAIQRFIGRLELGIIPSVLDTLIFIQNGQVNKVLDVSICVKVPSGMTESDLSRPVVEVKDFESGIVLYEMYTFGEQTVVIPVTESPTVELNENSLKKIEKLKSDIQSLIGSSFIIKPQNNRRFEIICDPFDAALIIGKSGTTIKKLEKLYKVKLDVNDQIDEIKGVTVETTHNPVTADMITKSSKKSVILSFPRSIKNCEISFYINEPDGSLSKSFVGTISRKNTIKIPTKTELGNLLVNFLHNPGSSQIFWNID